MRVALVQGLFAASVLARFDGDKGSASKLSHLVVGRSPGFLATCASPYGCLTWKLASLRGSDPSGGGVNQDGSSSVSWNSRLRGDIILPPLFFWPHSYPRARSPAGHACVQAAIAETGHMVFSPACCSCWRLFSNIRSSVCLSCSRVVCQADLRESLVAADMASPEADPDIGFGDRQFTWCGQAFTGMGTWVMKGIVLLLVL